MGHLVIYQRIVVHMLIPVGYDTAVALAFRAFALEHQVKSIAGDAIVQGDDVVVDTAVCLLLNIDIADACILVMCLLQAVQFEAGIALDIGLDDLRSQETAVVGSMVTE